jgi:hypothetical protein
MCNVHNVAIIAFSIKRRHFCRDYLVAAHQTTVHQEKSPTHDRSVEDQDTEEDEETESEGQDDEDPEDPTEDPKDPSEDPQDPKDSSEDPKDSSEGTEDSSEGSLSVENAFTRVVSESFTQFKNKRLTAALHRYSSLQQQHNSKLVDIDELRGEGRRSYTELELYMLDEWVVKNGYIDQGPVFIRAGNKCRINTHMDSTNMRNIFPYLFKEYD